MEERSTPGNELASRLREVEHQLQSIRAAIDNQSHAVTQIHSGLAGLQATLSPAGKRGTNGHPKALSALRQTVAGWYVASARAMLRADVEDLFDISHYLSRVPGLAESGIDPIFHFLRSKGAVSPHWLFDNEYYLRTYPDVASAKVNPLVHFLRSGWREGRNPHPLFRTSFYLDQAPELRAGNLNPVTHYLKTGWRNGLHAHPLFDDEYYSRIHPDIADAGMNPLTHYVLFGAGEGRHPHEWFDTSYYRQHNPDVMEARAEPVQHYIDHGSREGRNPHPLFDTNFYQEEYAELLNGLSPLEHFVRFGLKQGLATVQTDLVDRFLPVKPYAPPPPRGRTIDVIVPAYRGLAETRACLESVLAARNQEPFQLTVIDDLSPEPELSAYLRDASATGRFTLLTNPKNLGFVATVNRGMALHSDRDVVLLNSDTEVANDWLDRLVRSAYSDSRIGTVTPFSNNATICSYPRFCEDNPLPSAVTIDELDTFAAEVNQGRVVDIPTAVGFCMYIRRDCLAETGSFDVDAFGKGYGEENDFSLRAASRGWRNVLAADVFVYHAGSVSFAKGSMLLRERGVRALTDRYPKYPALISRHVSRNAALPYRFALTAVRYRKSPNPTVLIVTHNLGGGIGQHVEELVDALSGKVNFLILEPGSGSNIHLMSAQSSDGISLRLDSSRQYRTLVRLLRSCNVSRMHVHHVLGHSLSLEKLRHDLDVPLDFSVHDYFTICPRFVLADPAGRYCGEPDESGCNECIRTTLPHLNLDIGSWRAKYSWLLNSADRVLAPSSDAASRMSRRFPAARVQAAAHFSPIAHSVPPPVQRPRIEPDGVLTIGVLGVMSWHKGLANLERCAQIAKDRELPLEFVLVGYCEPQIRDQGPFTFRETGEYSRADLPAILSEADPGLIWFPMRWPETFSYTLSVCLEQGLPVAAPLLGALPERLSARPWTWVYDWATEPEELIDLFGRIRESMIAGSAPVAPPAHAQADAHFYTAQYRAGITRPGQARSLSSIDLRERGRLSVIALLSSYESGQMQSCGYIRAYLPLMHDNFESLIRLTAATAQSALTMTADVLLVQRTSIPSLALAEELIRHCERRGMRLVYETDDDLFNIDTAHTDSSFYTPLIAPAELAARHAGMVLVSSSVLEQRLSHLNPDIRVVPNALDETLWFSGKKPFRAASKNVRILYMGTMTHSRDLELLEEPMRMLKAEFGASVELDLIGIMPENRKRDWFNVINVPAIYGHSYPLFAEWIRNRNNWDFGVAPLVDDDFNRCKSYIKYLDYAALGIPGVFSGIGVFEEVVRQGETGLCVPDAASWYDAMRLLITDSKLRRKMGAAAYVDVETNHTLAAQITLRRNLWNQIGNLPPVRSNSTIVSFSDDTTATTSNGI